MLSARTFRRLRILILLSILFVVGLNSWLSSVRSHSWQRSVWVVLYPINADGRTDTQQYIDALDKPHFEEIEQFLQREAKNYSSLEQPVTEVFLADSVQSEPPEVPTQAGILESVIWSLSMRWWSWNNDSWQGPEPDVRIYLRYFSPNNRDVLEHSLGLQKGMIGLVNGFASIDYNAKNNFVIVHELLHTLGASDKYDPLTNEPVFPEGYADPQQQPLLPQTRAEVMGGRVKVSPGWILMPLSLDDVVVGPETAAEIGWRD
ncbi:hypothetical protein [Amphritea sp. HPY]|uniref:hypothetical protein n=1 Tax=Amphritea sp. HPY TaxID=3421652 RepID=UPI003D7DC3C0